MANDRADGKKARYGSELAQRTRKAILNAFEVVEKRGVKISELLADELQENPIKVMELASKFIPKQVDGSFTHDHKHTHETLSQTDQWLSELLGKSETEQDKKSLPN